MDYRVLGPLEVWADGTRLEIGAGRQRALLALLLLRRNEVLSMDRIVDSLWGERPPATAPKVVQGYVSQLRKVLGDGVLVTRPPGYELRVEEGEVDAERFDDLIERARSESPGQAAATLRRALELWRGAPLPDVAYESFAQAPIAHLEELRLAALEDRIDADLALGRAASTVPELDALVREHPLRERLRAQLMVALYRSGRQAEALDAYADYRRRLVDEVGLEPSAELQELQRRILTGDPALGSVRRTPVAIAARRAPLFVTAGLLLLATTGAALLLVLRAHSSPISIRSNEIVAIDPRTNRVVQAAAVGNTPSRVVTGRDAVWVVNADDRTISQVNPRTLEVRTVSPGGRLSDIAFGAGALWAANGDARTVTRIDPMTTEVARVVRLPHADFVQYAAGDERNVWVSGGARGRAAAWRIDPRTNRAAEPTALRESIGGWSTLGYGSVWIRGDTGVFRANERTGAVEAHVDLPWNAFVTEDTGGIAAGAQGIWVTSVASQAVWQIDPNANIAAASVPVGGTPSGIAVGGGSVWVTDRSDGSVLRIDPVTHRITQTIRLGHAPNGVAFGFDHLWVSVD